MAPEITGSNMGCMRLRQRIVAMNALRNVPSSSASHARLALGLLLAGVATLVHGAPGDTAVVSANPYSDVPLGYSYFSGGSAISADGRFVTFYSDQIYIRDHLTGDTQLISVDPSGAPGNSFSFRPAISDDGRYVVFESAATSFVPGDVNGTYDVFLRDRSAGSTECISVDPRGVPGNGPASFPRVSADGRFVVFASAASNLTPNDTNDTYDVFVRDRQSGRTEIVSVSSEGTQANNGSDYAVISADGRFVAFQSYATNLVPDDTNGVIDIFVRDRQLGVTERVSFDVGGTERTAPSFGPAISADGSTVGYFGQYARGPVWVHDRTRHATEVISVGLSGAANGPSGQPSLSGDGRYVAFRSTATNLVSGDTNAAQDIFVRDRSKKVTERVSVDSNGVEANFGSEAPSISADGRFVAFGSFASNLVPNDLNGSWDVFIHELGGPPPAPFAFTIKPSALAFGDRALNTRATLSVWLLNKGSTPLPILSVGLRGTDRAMFKLANRCPASVPVGTGCSMQVTFTPTSLGPKVAKLRVVAGDGAIRIINLWGTGVGSSL
jgi:Tol biopolymer transport system component